MKSYTSRRITMRSDRDKRTDTEREIDDFLSKFENPADELSADYSSYLNEKNTTKMTAAQTFQWKNVDMPDDCWCGFRFRISFSFFKAFFQITEVEFTYFK